jgi:hypothetical protein
MHRRGGIFPSPVFIKKASADDGDIKTAFALKSKCGLTTAQEKAKEGHDLPF